MSNCSNAQEILQDLDYKLIKSLFVGSNHKRDCRHIYRNSNDRYAYSDNTGIFYVDLDRAEVDKIFNAAVIKPKITPDIEDIDATLKELEDNLKVISVRILSYISDFINKKIERLS